MWSTARLVRQQTQVNDLDLPGAARAAGCEAIADLAKNAASVAVLRSNLEVMADSLETLRP